MNFPSSFEVFQYLDELCEPLELSPCQLEPVFSLQPLEDLYESSPRYEYPCSESTCDELASPLKSEEQLSPPLQAEEPKRLIGRLTYAERQLKLQHFRAKRLRRVWTRRINYDCRKKVADSRIRYKGRFVKKEDCHLYASLPDAQAKLS